MESARLEIEACIRDIELWMLINKLKMNNGKTGVAVFSSRYLPKPSLHSVSVCDKTVEWPQLWSILVFYLMILFP